MRMLSFAPPTFYSNQLKGFYKFNIANLTCSLSDFSWRFVSVARSLLKILKGDSFFVRDLEMDSFSSRDSPGGLDNDFRFA